MAAGFAFSLFVLACAAAAVFHSQSLTVESTDLVEQTHYVIEAVQDVVLDLSNLQNSRHGYVLSGDEQSRQRYQADQARLGQDLAALTALTGGHPGRQQRLATLEPLVAAMREQLDRSVAAAQTRPADQQVQTTFTAAIEERMAQLRTRVAEIHAEESRLLQARQEKATAQAIRTSYEIILGCGLAFIGLAGSLAVVRRDIAQHRRAERALRERETRLQRQVQMLELADILVRDAQDTIIYWNHGAQQLYGYSATEAVGRHAQELLQTEFAEPAERILAQVRAGRQWEGELRHRRKDGTRIAVASHWMPYLDPNGALQAIVEVNHDLGPLRKTEEDLRASRERLRLATEGAGVGTWDWDIAGNQRVWDERCRAIFGVAADRVITTEVFLNCVHPDDRQRAEQALQHALTGQQDYAVDFRVLWPDGSLHWLNSKAQVIRDAAGNPKRMTGVVMDITERKQAEEQLRLQGVAMQAAANAIVITDRNGTIQWVNEAFTRLTGYSAGDAIGRNPRLLKSGRHDGVFYRHLWQTILARRTWHGEMVNQRKDGRLYTEEQTIAPVTDASGRITNFIAIKQDVTARKETEQALEAAREELRRYADGLEETVSQRTAALRATIAEMEAFTYSLSHDMRAPLRAIHSYAQIVLMKNKDRLAEESTEFLNKIAAASLRMDRLIQDVLTSSRLARETISLQTVNVDRLVRDLIEERPEWQPPDAEISIQGALLPVRGHAALLTQCLTNLLDNAVKFVRRGEKPQVRLWTELRQDRVRLWCQDNGIGIAQESQPRIFQMFNRAHSGDAYKGAGIGLFVVHQAVQRMGGQVGVESEPGRGSRFWLELPKGR